MLYSVFQASPAAIITLSRDGRVLSWNDAAEDLLGWTKDEVLGKPYPAFPEDVKKEDELSQDGNLLQGEIIQELTVQRRTRDGDLKNFILSAAPLRDGSGDVIGSIRVMVDISEQRESRRMLSALIDNLPGMVYRCGIEEGWPAEFISEGGKELTGYEPEDLLEGVVSMEEDIIHSEDRQQVRRTVEASVAEGESFQCTYRIIHADGERRWVWEQGWPVRDEDGNLEKLEGLIIDITARKEAMRELELFRDLMDRSKDLIFIIDPGEGEILDLNQTAARELGYARRELEGKNILTLCDTKTQQDWPGYRRDLKERDRFYSDRNFVRSDGSKIPIEMNMGLVSMESDYIVAVGRDLTERQEMEEELERSRRRERRFRQLAEHVGVLFWLTNPDKSKQFYISSEYEDLFGRSLESLYDDPMSFLEQVVPEDRDRVREAYEHDLTEGFDLTYRIETPDGETRWIRDQAFPVPDEIGNIHRIAGIRENITSRKEREEKLESSLQRSQVLLKEVHHRVKNNLQIISSMLRMQLSGIDSSDQAAGALENSRDRIQAMSMIHEKLYESDNLDSVDLSKYTRELVDYLVEANRPEETEITVEFDLEVVSLTLDVAISVGLIINELTTNALEHAFTGREEGHLSFELHRDGETYRLSVVDDGTGFSESSPLDSPDTLGLQLVKTLASQQLEGHLEVDTTPERGTSITVVFPVETTRLSTGMPGN